MKDFNEWIKSKDAELYEGIMSKIGELAGSVIDKAASDGSYTPENKMPKQKKKQKKQNKK